MSPPPRVRKIALLGSRAVGKSSLTVQYVENHFAENYYPTIENTFTKITRFRGADYATEIIDTAGQDEYSILHSKHAIGIHGYVLVYAITSRASFEMTQIIRDKILNFTGLDWVPVVLVGNKSDLDGQRQVSLEEGQRMARDWNAGFLEASAKANHNIGRIFESLLERIE
ncbi:hypothetical protein CAUPRSCDRAFT_2064, partial [Caulochytrium protostelioides]